MKKLLFGLMLVLPFIAGAQQTKFTINGKIGNLGSPARIYIMYSAGPNKILDSAYIFDGSFTLNGEITNPTAATLMLDHNGEGAAAPRAKYDLRNFYLDKETITITATDSIAKARITGSKINEDNDRLMAKLSAIAAQAKKLDALVASKPVEVRESPEVVAAAQAKRKDIQAEYEKTLKSFVTENPDSFIALPALSALSATNADALTMEALYNGLSADLKATGPGKMLAGTINELKTTGIGAMAPDFTQNDVKGTPISLSSFRGKYVLLDFWASWCGPCRLENPNVVKAYNKYKYKKFTVLGVSLDPAEKKADWQAAIQHDGLTWPQVSDLKYWQNAAAALYFVRSIPQNFLIDPSGKIIAKNLRGEDLENKLAEIFGKI